MPPILTVLRVNDSSRPYSLSCTGLFKSQETELRKKWPDNVQRDDIKAIRQWCRMKGITYKGIPLSYARIKKNRPQPRLNVDETLWASLYEYQKKGVQQILGSKLRGRALLADEMGLGKTRQALACISHFVRTNIAYKVLVICPSYLQVHWLAGISEHVSTDVGIWKLTDCPDKQIVIISYGKVHARDVLSVRWHFVVCDEAHYIKNRKSKRAKAVFPIAHHAKSVLLLTGTPALNRPCEIYSLMYAIRSYHVPSYYQFAIRFCNAKKTRFGFDDRGSSNSEELKWLLQREYMIRRLKDNELDLPPKTRHHVTLEVPVSQLKPINEAKAELQNLGYSKDDMFKRQALISKCFRLTAHAKAESVAKWVLDATESKESLIVFAHHKIVLDTIEQELSSHDVTYMRIDGSVSVEERQKRADRFQAGKVQVAILSIMAAGTGFTLTRSRVVIFAELYWVSGVLQQAEARAHRIGQTNKVTVLYLIGNDTIDKRVYSQVCQKFKILDNALDGRTNRSMEPISVI